MIGANVSKAGMPSTGAQPVRVMLVDDSAVIRGMVKRWLEESDEIEIIATAHNGEIAVSEAASKNPDVIILDIEMPRMDGMTALPKILEACPGVKVIMSSTRPSYSLRGTLAMWAASS